MVVRMTFDLEEPGDADAFRRASAADDLCATLYDLQEWLRVQVKYEGREFEDVRTHLDALMRENGIDLERLWN